MDEIFNQQNPPGDFKETNVPEHSGTDENIPERSQNVPENLPTANHSLTVKEVLTMFWNKNVDITERSLTKYCHPNRQGVQLLDAYFDENERKFFITPESVPSAIEEVRERKIRMKQNYGDVPNRSEPERRTEQNIPEHSGTNENVPSAEKHPQTSNEVEEKFKKLEEENFDLKVSNQAKGQIIRQMQEDKKETLIMMREDRTFIGKLKTKLLQLGAPENTLNEEEKDADDPMIETNVQNVLYGQNEGN
ncbi:MAG: hypothetical protein HOF76_02080 [Candidatus Scalindua sp.]|jgi:hypothetical protein|nr:hypothetical protein [Candidatus Scalindua sp.]MBT7592109.1 hypothetical protein [Candidatus Scalindua sp.]